ncbi:MAG: hypothetical protein WCH99_04550 [Verrucomicrobiota bacterium]
MTKPALSQTQILPFERGLWNRSWFIIVLCLVFIEVDWELVPLKMFPFIFIFPVMLAAWNRSLIFTTVAVMSLSLTRLTHQLVFDPAADVISEFAAALIRFFVLMLLAMLTSQLGRQSRQLRKHVQALEGMLPICSFCKCIRNEKEEWVQLENYISGHSRAVFTHGLCPDCATRHYGDYAPKP